MRAEAGASLVEFAFVMPILALFLFGIVQFGIAYDKQQSINSAAREGARLGALEDTTLQEIAERATQAYDASAAPGPEPTVVVYDDTYSSSTPVPPVGTKDGDGNYSVPNNVSTIMPCGRPAPSDYITVVVSTPYDITIPFWGVHGVTITSEAQFRCE